MKKFDATSVQQAILANRIEARILQGISGGDGTAYISLWQSLLQTWQKDRQSCLFDAESQQENFLLDLKMGQNRTGFELYKLGRCIAFLSEIIALLHLLLDSP